MVFYPSDGVATQALVQLMANYRNGISYIRTTRMDTPVIYNMQEEFVIGGCKVIRASSKDIACVIGAGITLHEALKAYESLAAQAIAIAVIDMYSIKPIDIETIIATARASGNKIITVEDHYLEGGLGQAVTYAVRNANITVSCLAVTELPRSGKPEELLAWAGIDAVAIEQEVKKIIR
jgi:transketolase